LEQKNQSRLIPLSKENGEIAPAIERAKSSGAVTARPNETIRLAEIDPGAKAGNSKSSASKEIEKLRKKLGELQQALYAEHRRSLLIVIQAMDTGGKDGAVKNLCSGLDPNGVFLTNFKVPTQAELDHDFLWRVHAAVPSNGVIGVWNRSHYEDVLVPRVHALVEEKIWRSRYEDIRAFEKILINNGVTILKFFLHISKGEQKKRLETRLRDPHKLWKFNPGDLAEREHWDDYQLAYDDAINHCTTEAAPWHIIPANRKWARNLMMLQIVVNALEKMAPQYPAPQIDPKVYVVK
jgi:PPK2 family polyphosphate:nucleotide phosphotransferase